MSEIWKSISGWDGYEVSTLGRVRSWLWPSKGRQWVVNKDRGCRILKPALRNGYQAVRLSRVEKGVYHANVHKLVLETFVSERPYGMQACHFDGDKTNNILSNLRWDTPSENNLDKIAHGTLLSGELIGTSKLTHDDVLKIKDKLSRGDRAVCVAAEFGVHRNTIFNITSGRSWNER